MKRCTLLFVLIAVLLTIACNLSGALTENGVTANPTEGATTEIADQTPATLAATEIPTALPSLPIVYYYFVALEGKTFPAGSVVALKDVYILGPTLSDKARSLDPVTNIRSALEAMLNDPRNAWTSRDVGITSITFDDGDTSVALEGEYFGVGDVTLIAAREQIFLTVFAESAVQTATITLNGENIANLGVSHSLEAKPDDYMYTRAEVETFMSENAYPAP